MAWCTVGQLPLPQARELLLQAMDKKPERHTMNPITDSSFVDGEDATSYATTVADADAWISRVDPASGRTYYVNEATNERTWTLPDAEAGNESLEQHDAYMEADEHKDLAAAYDGLQHPWVPRMDYEHDRVYYVNPETGETSWYPPTDVGDGVFEEELKADGLIEREYAPDHSEAHFPPRPSCHVARGLLGHGQTVKARV